MQQELEKQIKRASEELKEVLCDAYNRYYVVDNTGTEQQQKQHASFVLGKIQVSLKIISLNQIFNPKHALTFVSYYESIVSTYLTNSICSTL